MAFKPNDQSYGHIHGIVCSNDLILCTRVHIGMANNVAQGSFHFRWTKKPFSIFRVPERRFFVKELPNNCCKIDQIIFLKHQAIFNAQLTKWLRVNFLDPPLVKKTNFRRFSWKRVKFELQLPCSLPFIYFKNHFQVHKYLFNHRNTKKFQDSTTSQERSFPPF